MVGLPLVYQEVGDSAVCMSLVRDAASTKMVFVVTDAAMLVGLSEGTKIRFLADRVNGKLTVTEIEVE